ncbi:MAG TPA: hypothetical protein VM010_01365 [Chitinophagaceae bacterium]|nr:hypothetical protein [Chitinophagaceae bacterium]
MPLSALFSQYSTLLPILVVLFLFRKVKDWHVWVIFFYCIYSFTNDSLLLYRDRRGLSIRTFLYSFTILEYLIFALYIHSILASKAIRQVLAVISVLLALACFYFIVTEPLKQFDSVQSAVCALLLISICIIYFFEQINKPQLTLIYASYHFWVIIGILIYLAGNFFLLVFASKFGEKEIESYWIINHISSVLKNILFAIAILIYVKTPKNNKPQMPLEGKYQPFLN